MEYSQGYLLPLSVWAVNNVFVGQVHSLRLPYTGRGFSSLLLTRSCFEYTCMVYFVQFDFIIVPPYKGLCPTLVNVHSENLKTTYCPIIEAGTQ